MIERTCLCQRGLRSVRRDNGLEEVQQELRGLHREIGFSTGKPQKQGKLKKLYYQLLRRGRRVCRRFERELAVVEEALNNQKELLPSQRLVAEEVLALIAADIQAIGQVYSCRWWRRVLEGEKVASSEKLISVSDGDAAFIVKGGWNTVVGYRPQLGRSGQGFVTALIVPTGNAADGGQLVDVVLDDFLQSEIGAILGVAKVCADVLTSLTPLTLGQNGSLWLVSSLKGLDHPPA